MEKNYDLNSILNAIEDINTKPQIENITYVPPSVNKIIINDDILPITEKLILEAERHSNKFKNESLIPPSSAEDVLILNNEYTQQNLEVLNLEKIKLNIIDDLYSSLSKKIKKNTLKTIFDLREKIISLETELEILNTTTVENNAISATDSNLNKNNEHLINDEKEHLINEDILDINKNLNFNEKNEDLSLTVVKTLQLQESTIKKFEKNEEKLLLKIVDLEQDISLLNNKKKNSEESSSKYLKQELTNNLEKNNKESNQANFNAEMETNFYKKNYEKLIIENHDIKKKLTNTKNMTIIYEQNIKELEIAFENLKDILSKNSIINLNQSFLKDDLERGATKKSKIKFDPSVIHIADKEKE